MNEVALFSIIFVIAQVFTKRLLIYYKREIERAIRLPGDFVRIMDNMYLRVLQVCLECTLSL